MKQLNIVKSGLTTTVDEVSYEKFYKPNGWTLTKETKEKIEPSISMKVAEKVTSGEVGIIKPINTETKKQPVKKGASNGTKHNQGKSKKYR